MNPHQQGSTTGTMGTASNLAGGGRGVRPVFTPSRPLCFSEQHPGTGTSISITHLALGVLC